ncbi:GDP GTP exchange factor [Cordyceps militaris]|uniref:GDP GTP exchange factor n=1 Tax=Cordyceps militaris TaxID=73501 RepID=A0A2H4SFU9_CORMI|nr:GDP GTP exchange factor [Cordyceps militaris]
MDSFIHVPGWSQHLSHRPSSARPLSGHFRSLSSVSNSKPSPPSPSSLPRPSLKSPKSTSQLPKISLSATFLNDEMSTLPDPRSRRVSNAEDQQDEPGTPSHHPDLSDEIATLSTKLINAINHQTALDDTLSATRQELQSAHGRIHELEQQNETQREMMAGDVWIRKSTVESDKRAIKAKLDHEVSKRLETEAENKRIETELETLATALFEEANKMVIVAKEESKEREDAVQRKNDLLKAQLEESEALLRNQQTQLSELKRVMESMSSHDDQHTNTTAPSSPGLPRLNTSDRLPPLDAAAISPLPDLFAPAPPTSFPHLILPVLRNDLSAYDDFINLAHQSHKRAGSRISSGSMGGLAALGLGLAGSTSSGHMSNNSTSSLQNPASAGSGPPSPNTPASSTQGTPNQQLPIPALKETKFYKRVIVEDIEPTLRLDSAPGLSWLARRSVLTAVTDGSLVVEPVPTNVNYAPTARPQLFPCALCGEARKETQYLRNHRFRTSESPSAQRYPLCNYCLGRVRSTCGFLGFLRMVKDGHWRADDEGHEKTAWEESVRLREQMFWSRIGGGVIPASQAASPTDDVAPASVDKVLSTTLTVPSISPVAGQTAKSAGDAKHVFDHKAPVREPRTPPEQTDMPTPVSQYGEPALRKDTDQEAAAEQPVIVET